MFAHNIEAKFTLTALDTDAGTLQVKIGKKSLSEKLGSSFPTGITSSVRIRAGCGNSGGPYRGRQ